MTCLLLTIFLVVILLLWASSLLTSSALRQKATQEIAVTLKKLGLEPSNIHMNGAQWGGIMNPLCLYFEHISFYFPLDQDKCTLSVDRLQLKVSLQSLIQNDLKIPEFSLKNLTIHHKNKKIGHLSVNMSQTKEGVKVFFENCDINTTYFSYLLPSLAPQFSNVHLPLKIQGSLWGHPDLFSVKAGDSIEQWVEILKKNIIKGDFFVGTLEKGTCGFKPFYPISLVLDPFKAHIHYENKRLSLDGLTLTEGETKINIQGEWLFHEADKKIDMAIGATAHYIPLGRLSVLWPVGLADSPRNWVIENLSVGYVPKATLNMKAKVTLPSFDDFHLTHLSGDIEAKDVTVQYLDYAPPVEGTSGLCQYTQDEFRISAQGKVNGLVLEKGDILINDFDKEDQRIQLNLDLSGPVVSALEIISGKSLALPQKLGIKDHKIFQGDSQTHVFLDFPLIKKLPLEKIKVISKSIIQNGFLVSEKPPFSLHAPFDKSPLEKAFFTIVVDNHHLQLDGTADVFTFPSQVMWREDFFQKGSKKKIEYQSEWCISPHIDLKNVSFLPSLFKGKIPVSIRQKTRLDKTGELSVIANLKEAHLDIPYLFFFKEKGIPLTINLMATFDAQEEYLLKTAKMEGEHISVLGHGHFNQEKMGNIHLDVGKFGSIEGKFDVSGPYQKPTIKGHIKNLDLERVLSDPTLFNPQDPITVECLLDLTLGKIYLGRDFRFDNINCQLHWANNHLQSIHVHGNPSSKFELLLAPSKPHKQEFSQRFSLISENAGDLLDYFYPKSDLEGGIIQVVGHRYENKKGESRIEGEVDIRDIMVKEAPFLAQLLSAASLEGFLNTLTGSGIQFDHCTGKINWTSTHLVLKNIHFSGGAIGLQLGGEINTKTKEIQLHGEVYPFNGLNYIIANIPLVGSILSGGNKKGVFSTNFLAKGSFDNPRITVNPLTTITPGGIRRVLREASRPDSYPGPLGARGPSPASPTEATAEIDKK